MDIEQDITSPNLSYNLVQHLVNQSQIGVAQLRINQEQNENQFTFAIGYSSNQWYGCNPIYSNGLNIKLGTDQKTLYINTGIPDSNGIIKNKNILFDSTNNYYISNAIFYPQNIYSNQQSNSLSYQTQIISQYLKQITSGFLFNSNVIFDTLNQQYLKANFGTLTYVDNIERGIQYTSNGTLQSSSNIIWDYSTNSLGINTATPQCSLDVKGKIQTNQQSIAQQLVSTLSSNDSSNQPIVLQNSNMISNLNTQYFQGLTPDYFRNVNNVNNGVLPVVFGGTGQKYISNGQLIFGSSVTTQTTSNLYWDNSNNRLGINTSNPQYTVDVVGNVNVQSLVQTVGLSVAQSAMIGSNLVINSNLTVSGTETANNIQVVNTITSLSNLSSNSTVNSNLIVGNQLTSLSNIITNETINSNLNVGLNTTIGCNLQVVNQITTSSNLSSNITVNSNLTVCNQLISTITTGTAPLNVTSTTLVSNLNVQYLYGQPQSYYTNASNISSGTLNVLYGGTGINTVINGQLFYASNNIFAQTSNLYYNNTSNFFGINNSSPSNPLDVIGNTYIKGNLTVNGDIFIVGSNSPTTSNTSNASNTTSNTNASSINGILPVTNGGTGFSNAIQGQLLFGQGVNQLGQSSNLFWDSTNQRLGIRTSTPQHGLDVIGNIQCSSNFISSNQIISVLNTGTAPIQVSSTTLVSNLNVQYLNGQLGSYYTNACNIQSGILGISYGGTGINTISNGCIFFASNNVFTQSSNLFWDVTNFRLGIKTTTPQYEIDVLGNIQCSNLMSCNQVISLVSNGTAPIQVSSTTLVSNLNVQYLNGQISSYYTNASNIQSGVLGVSYGGTGVTVVSNGCLFFASNNIFSQSSNLFWDATNQRLGIRTTTPQHGIDVMGVIQCSSNLISSNQIISLVSVGTAPIQVTSTTLVSNLNVQYLNGQMSSYYTNANNISQGVLGVSYGGTGISNVSNSLLLFGSNNTYGQSSNLYYNYSSNYLGIGTSNPLYSIHSVGNIFSTSNVTSTNQLISLVSTGTSPIQVTSTTLVSNLNVQYLNGQVSSYYTNANNIQQGVLGVSYGGTGISSVVSGQLLFGGNNIFSQSSNLYYNNQSNFLGIGTSNPLYSVHSVGNIFSTSNITSTNQLISLVSTGTAPVQVQSTTLVSNLNAQYLNGQLGTYYTNANNISSGVLGVSYGGTGVSSVSNGFLLFGSNNTYGQSSNLYYNSTSNFFGIGTSNPSYPIHSVGSIFSTSNIISTNQQISLVSTGTAPMQVASTTLVSNLNVQYLNSQSATYYTNANNISSGILNSAYGGTGLSSLSTGQILFGQGSNPVGVSSNLFWDSSNYRLGVRNPSPQQAIDVVGNINCSSNIYLSNQLVSTIAVGTAPLSVVSTTLVSNLNVQYLNGQLGSYYTNATNISSGILAVGYGGTGLSGLSQGFIPFGTGSTAFGSSSNLFWNNTSNFLGINNTNPANPLDVVGNTYIKGNLTVTGFISIVGTSGSGGSSGGSTSTVMPVASGGTGLSIVIQGYIPFGQGINSLGQSSNLFWDSTNQRLGIKNSSPQQAIDVVGNINCSSNIYISNQLISTIAVGTSPFSIASTTLVTNLNAQYLNNNPSTYYTNASNISSGILGIQYGGTGISTVSNGNLFFASNSVFSQSSNLFWDSTNQRLGIKNSNPQQAIDVVGNITCSSNIYLSNQLISTIGVGTAPFNVASTTLVTNLNAQYLNNNPSTYYTNANNISSGILQVFYGGTGLNQINSGYIPIGNGTNALNLSSNLYFDVSVNNLGLGTTSPINDIHIQSSSSLHPIIGLSNSTQQSFLQISSFLSIPQISSSSNGFSLGYTPTFTSNQSNYSEICRVDQKGLTTNNITFTNPPNFSSLNQFYYNSNQTAAASVQLYTNKASYGVVGSSFTFVSGSNQVTTNYSGIVQFNCYIYATYNPVVLTTPTYVLSVLKNNNVIYQMSSSTGYSSLPLELAASCVSNDVFQMTFNATNATIQILNGSVVSLKRTY